MSAPLNEYGRGFVVVILAAAAVVAVAAGGWALHWKLAQSGQDHRYEVNTHSQQYQAGLESQARDDAQGYTLAADPGQKMQIKLRFCAVYKQLTQPAADLSADAAQIGC